MKNSEILVKKEIPKELRDAVIYSCCSLVGPINLSQLITVYQQSYGTNLPFKEYGYPNLSSFIETFPEIELEERGPSSLYVSVKVGTVFPTVENVELILQDVFLSYDEYHNIKNTPIRITQLVYPHGLNVIQCYLCDNIVSRPVVTPCSHLFCCTCFENFLKNIKNIYFYDVERAYFHCPCCSAQLELIESCHSISSKSSQYLKDLWNIINIINITCCYRDCLWTGIYSNWLKHINVCESYKKKSKIIEKGEKYYRNFYKIKSDIYNRIKYVKKNNCIYLDFT